MERFKTVETTTSRFQDIVQTLKQGDRIVVPKSAIRWIQHHAIFLGQKNGQHWFIENKEGVGVRIVDAEHFFSDVLEVTRVERFIPTLGYNRDDLMRRALSLLGKKYSLLGYNCESFANQVQHGTIKSAQANTGVGLGLFGLVLFGLIALDEKRLQSTDK